MESTLSTTADAAIYIIFAMTFFKFALKIKEFFDKDSTNFKVQDREILQNIPRFEESMKEKYLSLRNLVNDSNKKINKFESWLEDIKRHTSPSRSPECRV